MEKVTVIKTFELPKLIYTYTVLEHPPDQTIKDITTTIFNFLWDGKTDKIKRKLLQTTTM
jgi:hypothetical protein